MTREEIISGSYWIAKAADFNHPVNEWQKLPCPFEPENCKYHSSWDWQIPAWSNIISLVKSRVNSNTYDDYTHLLDQYENAVFANTPEVGFGVLLKAISLYDKMNRV